MNKQRLRLTVLSAIFIVTLLVVLGLSSTQAQAQAYTDVPSKVKFNFDVDMGWEDPYPQIVAFANSGNGTELDPFIIEWYRFNGEDAALWLISLPYYFVIRNCIFQPTGGRDAVWFDRTDFIEVYDCQFYSGVELTDSNNSTFYNNGFYNTRLYVSNSRYTSFTNNTFTGAGTEFVMFNSHYIYFGLNLMEETSTSLRFQNGITYGMFENNTILNCQTGAQISEASFNTIRYNTIINCTYYGILLEGGSTGNVFYGNIIENVGLELPAMVLSEVAQHSAFTFTGESSGNNITWNTLDGNEKSAIDNSGNFYESNYWSDYNGFDDNEDGFGDSPYEVAGTAGSQDNKPRMIRDITSYTLTPTETITEEPDFPQAIIIVGLGVIIISCVALVLIVRSKHE